MTLTSLTTQKESKQVERQPENFKVMHYHVDYDKTNPEQTIRKFVMDIREMISRYEWNADRISEIEKELLDLEHYIEIAPNQTVPNGYKLYKKIAELRRERRSCKNENDLLKAVYEYFHATNVLDKMSICQGEVAKVRAVINSRCYTIRTNVLDESPDVAEVAP